MTIAYKPRIYLLVCFLLPVLLFGQIDSTRSKLVKILSKDIYTNYLDAGLAKAMQDTILNKLATNKYDTSLNIDEFVYEVQKDLRRVSNDNHITIEPAHTREYLFEPRTNNKQYSKRQWQRQYNRYRRQWNRFERKYRRRTQYDMFTYGDIKILPGNIGYVELKDFKSTSFHRKENRHRISIKSVLRFFQKTDAIIIDLRENTGGYIFLSAKLCSYFSDEPGAYFITTESVFRYDSAGEKKELKYSKRRTTDKEINNDITRGKKIFVLTSKRTFSAGELSTYKLKQLNHNTTIVGEKTTGGGNGHYGYYFEEYYTAIIPCIRVFDENNYNYTFEAKGITPDIEVVSDSALSVAYNMALKESNDKVNDKTKEYRKQKVLTDEREVFFMKNYNDYVGNYRKIRITKENGKLYITYDDYTKQVLIPDAVDFFITNDFKFVRFSRNADNIIVEIQVKHMDGYLEIFHRQ